MLLFSKTDKLISLSKMTFLVNLHIQMDIDLTGMVNLKFQQN